MSFNASTAGLRVLRHVLGLSPKEAAGALTKAQPFLNYDDDQKVVTFIRTHLAKFGTLPTTETIMDQLTVYLPEITEPLEYDLQQLRNRFIEDGMRDASDEASALIAENKQDLALQSMLQALLPLTHFQNEASVFDIRNMKESALANYLLALDKKLPPPQLLGFDTLDAQGGLEDGDMIGIIGRPGSGKTWLMLFTALAWWGKYKEPVLFVTQEMSQMQIERRVLPMVAEVDPTPLYRGEPIQYQLHGLTPEDYVNALKDAAEAVKTIDAPFLLYDSKMAGTVADVENIAAMHGCKRVWIDGAYMLRHPDPRLGRYARVPENLDLLKQFGQRTGAAIFTSWQFKRNAGKNDAAGEEPDLDDIGYSHAIAEYCGVILGLLENPKNVDQMNHKKVSIMKGRNGEVGSFNIHWDFKNMKFDEVKVEETTADLTYL